MVTQGQLLEAWVARKSVGRNFYRLEEPQSQEFAYRGPRMGHPSNFAAIHLRCEPANELTFQSTAPWPQHLPPAYCVDLERAIGCGIVDSLMSHVYYTGS